MSTKPENTVVAPASTEASAPPEKQPEPAPTAVIAPEPTKEEPIASEPQSTEPATTTEQTKSPPPAETESKLPDTNTPAAPEPESKPTTPTWPSLPSDHPLSKFHAHLPTLLTSSSHSEIWGITLSPSPTHFHTKLILQKFLRANGNDLPKAQQQLLETLKWRKEFDPVAAAAAKYDKSAFEGLGYVCELEGVPGTGVGEKTVVTFNVYGAVRDNRKTFGDLERFLRWRVGLMERSVQKLKLADATTPIPDYGQGPDPYQGFQVHDYLQVSFIRQDPLVKAATKKTIETLSRYYPETLARKFFVNVPVVMGWIYSAMKLLVPAATAKKFTVMSYGEQLVGELGERAPKEYGGKKGALGEVGEGMALEEEVEDGVGK